jgi:acyl carrier protein
MTVEITCFSHQASKEKLCEIMELLVPYPVCSTDTHLHSNALHQIVSDSMQAIRFISLIESEFEIEFDDDYINSDFFSSIDYILTAIANSSQ